MSQEVAVVILAGGEGRRMGGDKPLRTLNDERLIDRALRQARRWSSLVAVSVRCPRQVEPVDAALVTDAPAIEGPLGGVASALMFGKTGGCDLVLTIAADMPFLPRDLLQRLSAGMKKRECALGRSGARLHPACSLWRTRVLRDLPAYVAGGKRSIIGFAELVGFEAVAWAAEPVDPFFNINTAADLARARRLIGA